MKNFLSLIVCLSMLSVVFTGCSDDDDDENRIPTAGVSRVDATINGVGEQIDSVFLTLGVNAETVLLRSEFKDNQFKFDLPEDVNSGNLFSLSDFEEFKGLSISNSSARVCYAEFNAYKGTERSGYIVYSNGETTLSHVAVNFIYVDRDVTISGKQTSTNEGFEIHTVTNCSFVKGWNLIAFYSSETPAVEHTTNYTTDIPSGIKWSYVPFE